MGMKARDSSEQMRACKLCEVFYTTHRRYNWRVHNANSKHKREIVMLTLASYL